MNSLDKSPPPHARYPEAGSVNVTLHYPAGTATGYLCPWSGWIRWQDNGTPAPCDQDAELPMGWSEISQTYTET